MRPLAARGQLRALLHLSDSCLINGKNFFSINFNGSWVVSICVHGECVKLELVEPSSRSRTAWDCAEMGKAFVTQMSFVLSRQSCC